MELAIYGSGGFGREMLDLARQINARAQKWDKVFFVIDDEYYNSELTQINETEILKWNDVIDMYLSQNVRFVIAQGEPIIRWKLMKKIVERGFQLETLIHPNVYIPESTQVGKGVIIQCNCFISSNVIIDDNVVLQPGVNIGHDSVVSKNSIISGLSNLAGNVKIGENTYVGLSTLVKEKTSIGSNTIVGMGSTVYKDIEDGVVALGNPARVMKRNIEQRVFK